MDGLINGDSNVDNLEGQPISLEGMGIQETSIGGAEISDTSIRPVTETGSVANLSPDVSGFATGLDAMLDANPNLGIQEVASVNPDAPLPALSPADLRAELGEVFNPSFSTLGHGTRPEVAQEILQQGLRAKQPDLASTTVPLFDESKPYEDQEAQVAEKILHWPHNDSKAVVIVMIPNPQEGELGGNRYFNSVFQELPEPSTGENARYLIPPSYIRGYVDTETKKFIPNPKFQPEKPTVTGNEAVSRITPQAVDSSSPVDIPTATTNVDSETPDVW